MDVNQSKKTDSLEKTHTDAAEEDHSLARLLFCQTLLEEYEGLDQPELDQGQVNRIKQEIEQHHEKYRFDEAGRKEEEPIFEGRILKDIFRLINQAQAKKAKQSREGLDDDDFVSRVLGNPDNPHLQSKSNGDGSSNGDRLTVHDHPITPDEAEKLAGSTLRSALCLSGGGVRSATFNLGIIQGLARHGLLDKFDYLSTVSGGGFIGGWLSAWIRREGLENVVRQLKEPPQTPLKPDPHPVEHLRVFSNYLSPQPGLLSADTWTLVASVVRNLLLNWLVFVPVLLALLLVPRMWSAIVLRSTHDPVNAIRISLIIGFLSGLWALCYIGYRLPSSNNYSAHPTGERYKGGQEPFVFRCLIWLVISAAALSVCLWSCYQPGKQPLPWYYYAGFMSVIGLVAWFFCFLKIRKITPEETKKERRYVYMLIAATLIIVVVVPLIVGFIASSVILLTLPIFHKHHVIYSVFSVPLILLLMGLKGLLITGFTSRFSKDDDQEWWARAGAWVLIVAISWIMVHLLVLYGPLLILTLQSTYQNLRYGGLSELEWDDWGKILGTIAGVVSGMVTLFGGFSAQTPANSKEAQKAGTGGVLLGVATQLLAPVFFGFLIILLSLGTNWILISRPIQGLNRIVTGTDLPYVFSPLAEWHLELIKATSFRVLVIVAALLWLLGAIMGRLISTNVFSLQYLWRNRIIRAYLGASHVDRHPDPFTGFDGYDNLQMHELWPQPNSSGIHCSKREDRPAHDLSPVRLSKKLFHVLNIALNLTGGEKLQWQDRKAESFTVSPFHSGSYWLGYRRSTHYGGTDGITLGASVAISGAFVSPNMGFMMTSAIVRFLMAIFNVRFGWWLGNPGPAGDKPNVFERIVNAPAKLFGFEAQRPFCQDSPGLSIIPFLSEALGNTDDKSPYVYLSDGGHFENLGLYEMVLRRCRFIVVCDATTDPEYSFESLAMSIRQIRVDHGVPIEIPELSVGVPSQNLKSKYCAIGKIRYSCVDRDPNDPDKTDEDYDGILIFIKPSLIGQEPRDVINYWQGRASFPQEVITDQWFSEAQFESYRALGSYIIEAICEDKSGAMTLAGFSQKAEDHNRLNFRAFQEQIGYLALEHEFKRGMQDAPLESYRSKVRRFMESLLR